MITPSQIRKKAQRLYPQFVKSWLKGENIFPRRIPADLKLPKDLATTKRMVNQLRSSSKQSSGHGYSLLWESRASRSHGLNQFPVGIQIETQSDLLHLARTGDQFAALQNAVESLRHHQPDLENWLLESTHWKDLLNVAPQVEDLLQATQYLLDHPRPNCFAREIPLPISTKLIEDNRRLLSTWLDILLPHDKIDFRFGRDDFERRYGLRRVRHHVLVRILDPELQNQLNLKFAELSLPTESINRLQPQAPTVLIVENKVNLLTLPPMTNGIALGGLGKATSLLQEIDWLHNATILYWGDLDVEGFEILSQFRTKYAHTQSLLMDMETLQQHSELAISWKNKPNKSPTILTEPERATYEYVLQNQKRLEQERIPQPVILDALKSLGLYSQPIALQN